MTGRSWYVMDSVVTGSANDSNTQELHAGHVESTLLSQVRVAMVGQEIDVWVLGRTRVRLQVGEFSSAYFSVAHCLPIPSVSQSL